MISKITKIFTVFSLLLLIGVGCSLKPERVVQDGGVWYSNDKGETWEQKIFANAGDDPEDPSDDELLDQHNILFLKFHPRDSRIIYANTNQGVYFTENSGDNWQKIYGDVPVNDLVADQGKRGTLYAAVGSDVLKTEDNGATWQQVYTDSRSGVNMTQLEIDPSDSKRIYLGTSAGDLLLSLDSGASWQASDSFLEFKTENRFKSFPITEILVNTRNIDQIYVASVSQGILASYDRGASWQNLLPNYKDLAGANVYKDLLIDPTRDNTLLYASGHGLLWTFDAGVNWFSLELLTPPNSINIRTLAINPKNPDEIYYANETVMYKTFDGGSNWIAENLPNSRLAKSMIVDFFDPNKIYLGVERPPKQRRGLIGL